MNEDLADFVAAVHVGYFVFIVGGFIGIVAGTRVGWIWIRNPWFRITHLLAVLLVVAEDVFHFPCALNVLENHLRATSAGVAAQPKAAGRVLDLLLRHTIPGWFLDAMYWTLGAVLLLLIFLLPPRFRDWQLR